jgi:uncharacterized protein YbaR (Trm112 family)
VHNEFARDQLLQRTPEAAIYRVPMGVPLPRLVEQQAARKALGLPETAFIVASVTHMTPYKRIPVVLRAVRRLAARLPETFLVLAGSVAPGMDLERQAALLGLQPRLRTMGYVDDVRARLVARAADVCVNLRYPVTGETSASLLRLLGAERPVIVTDGAASAELAEGVGLRVACDWFEEEMLVELLWELANDEAFRVGAGLAARAFIESEHTMERALDGYRSTLADVFEVSLTEPPSIPSIEEFPTDEQLQAMAGTARQRESGSSVGIEARVADELCELGLGTHDQTLRAVARRMVELEVDGTATSKERKLSEIDPSLLEILVCPICAGELLWKPRTLVCSVCGRRYPVYDGITNFIVTGMQQNKRSG